MTEQGSQKSSIVNSTLYVLVTGVLVTVAGQWAVNQIWPSTEAPIDINEIVKQSPISLQRWQEMTVQLNSAPGEVRERIFDDYRGETVVWVGYFDQFRSHTKSPGSSQTAISLIMYDSVMSLESKQPLGTPFVRCFFSQSQLPAIEKLRRGQRVVVRGTLANPTLLGSMLATDLNVCELLATEDDSQELALVPGATLR